MLTKNKENKFKKIFNFLLDKAYLLVLLLVTLIFSFGLVSSYVYISAAFNNNIMNIFFLLLGTFILYVLTRKIYKCLKKLSNKSKNIMIILLFIIFFAGLVISAYFFESVPVYDLSDLIKECNNLVSSEKVFKNNGYFSIYSNNFGVIMVLYPMFKLASILGIKDNIFFVSIINSGYITLTAIFLYLILKNIKNKDTAISATIFMIINPIFYLYSSYFYTDTLMMPYSLGCLYFILNGDQSKNKKTKYIDYIIGGILVAIGYKVRAVNIFIYLAIIVIKLFYRKDWLKNLKAAIFITMGLVMCVAGFSIYQNTFTYEINSEWTMPVTHWIMMGSNYDTMGQYKTGEDYALSQSVSTKSERIKLNIETIIKRVKKMKLFGLIKLYIRKMSIFLSNGTSRYTSHQQMMVKYTYATDYLNSNKKVLTDYLLQIMRCVTLLFLVISLIIEIRKKEKNAIVLSLFLLLVFYALWEVQERYILCFLPVIFLMIFYNITSLWDKDINKLKITYTEEDKKLSKKIDINKLTNIIKIFVIILTICLAVLLKNEYTNKKDYTYQYILKAAYNAYYDQVVEINNEISQTFNAANNFNLVFINLDNSNVKTGTYQLSIINDEKEVFSQEFDASDMPQNGQKKFYCGNLKAGAYTIKIKKISNDEESMSIHVFKNDNYDFIPNTSATLNGESSDYDMKITLVNSKKKAIFSKKEYLIICLIYIGLEIIAFIPLSKKATSLKLN